MMPCLLESTTVLLSMTTASPYCSCFYFLKQGLTFVRLLIFFFILWMCMYRHHVICCSSLVEAASALLVEHRGRIFCVSLDRLFVSLDRSAALCSRAAFTDQVVMCKACNGDKANLRQREVCIWAFGSSELKKPPKFNGRTYFR